LTELTDVDRLLESGEATDFTIVCGQRSLKVHRLVLTLHSNVLGCACNGAFSVSDLTFSVCTRALVLTDPAQEATTARFDLSEYDEECINTFIAYLYTFKYIAGDSSQARVLDIQLAILADKYNIPQLADLAIDIFRAHYSFYADHGGPVDLACSLDGPTKPFREIIVAALVDSGVPKTSFQQTIRSHPELALDIALVLRGHLANHTRAHESTQQLQLHLPDLYEYVCIACGLASPADLTTIYGPLSCPRCNTRGLARGNAIRLQPSPNRRTSISSLDSRGHV